MDTENKGRPFNLSLSQQEFDLLRKLISVRLLELRDELVHTDSRAMQSALSKDLRQAKELQERLEELENQKKIAA